MRDQQVTRHCWWILCEEHHKFTSKCDAWLCAASTPNKFGTCRLLYIVPWPRHPWPCALPFVAPPAKKVEGRQVDALSSISIVQAKVVSNFVQFYWVGDGGRAAGYCKITRSVEEGVFAKLSGDVGWVIEGRETTCAVIFFYVHMIWFQKKAAK
jgi:hypothetical protein